MTWHTNFRTPSKNSAVVLFDFLGYRICVAVEAEEPRLATTAGYCLKLIPMLNSVMWFGYAVFLISLQLDTVVPSEGDGSGSSFPILKQVHVITRHGARFPLTKHATTLHEGTPGTLTPRGEKQMYDLGTWLASRYGTLQADFVPDYVPHKVHLTSSSLDRTITSANSLALGLFADWQNDRDTNNALLPAYNIPVYSQKGSNDVTIRAYDKCPVFLKSLSSLYASQEWKQLEKSSLALRAKLAERIPVQNEDFIVPLEDVWNAFDAILVAKTECGDDMNSDLSSACQSLPDATIKDFLSEGEWADLQQLAHTAELKKYGTPVAGLTLGNNLLHQILSRMAQKNVENVKPEDGAASFYLYSAHYPTLLGMFAALGQDPSPKEVIPSYASALVFELYQVGDSELVKLLYRTGEDLLEANSNKVLGFDKVCPLDEMCPLHSFQRMLPAGWSEEEWCEICDNVEADVCLASIVKRNGNCSLNGDDNDAKRPALAGFLSGAGVAFVCLLASSWYCRRRRVKSDTMRTTESDTSQASPKSPDSPII